MTFIQDEVTTQLLRNNEPLPIPLQNLRVKTWFLKKENGEILAVSEGAAWHMLNPNHNSGLRPPSFKIIGTSFAQIYAQCVIDIQKLTDPEEKKRLLRQAFEDELAEAMKTPQMPRNPNIQDINGRPITDPTVLSGLPR